MSLAIKVVLVPRSWFVQKQMSKRFSAPQTSTAG
jgi:hypothetical protein